MQSERIDVELSSQLATAFALDAAEISNLQTRAVIDLRFVVGDLAIGRLPEADSSVTRMRWSTQTAAYHVADPLRLPQFDLRPESVAVNLAASFVGVKAMDFPAHPEFSRHYRLIAPFAEEMTRKLFDDTLIMQLGHRAGLNIRSARHGLLVFRPATLYGPDSVEAFIAEAVAIFRLFRNAARRVAESGLVPEMEARAAVRDMPAMIGPGRRGMPVTRADAEAFALQAPPRKIPAGILGYRDEFAPPSRLRLAALFALFGAVMGLSGWIFALPGILIGVTILSFWIYTRRRLTHLLRNGQRGIATIENISELGLTMPGGSPSSRVTVRFEPTRETVRATCNVAWRAIGRVNSISQSGQPATVLYDPANPQNFLLVAALYAA